MAEDNVPLEKPDPDRLAELESDLVWHLYYLEQNYLTFAARQRVIQCLGGAVLPRTFRPEMPDQKPDVRWRRR